MTTTTADALHAALPKLVKTGTVFHAFREEDDFWGGNELYADLDTALKHSAVFWADEEYGGTSIPGDALQWREDCGRWGLIDQGVGTGVVVQERNVFGSEAAEPKQVPCSGLFTEMLDVRKVAR